MFFGWFERNHQLERNFILLFLDKKGLEKDLCLKNDTVQFYFILEQCSEILNELSTEIIKNTLDKHNYGLANTIGGCTVKNLVKKCIYGYFPLKLPKKEVAISLYFYWN